MRGLAQAIRYVLAYSGVPFRDVRYQQGGHPDFSRQAWLDVKEKLQLDFPNLPYYIEAEGDATDATSSSSEEIKLTQSTTILRHLGRKHGLVGRTLKEQAMCDLLFDTAYDYKSILVDTAYSRQRVEAFQHFAAKTQPHYFAQFERSLERSAGQWCAGSTLTIADFFLAEMLDQSVLMVPGCLDAYPKLKAFLGAFGALAEIQAYRKSDHYIERPLNNMAGFQ